MLSYIAIFFVIVLASGEELPSYFHKCSKSDPNFKSCLIKNAEAAVKRLTNEGDAKYKVNSLTPIRFYKLNLQASPSLTVDMDNVEIDGFENIVFKDFEFTDNKLIIKSAVDRVETKGVYNMKGQILVLPIQGTGGINMTIENMELEYVADLKRDKYFSIAKDKMSVKIKRIHYHLTNLFNGNEQMGSTMNAFLNENWYEVYDEVSETFDNFIANIFNIYITAYFSKVPIVDLIKN